MIIHRAFTDKTSNICHTIRVNKQLISTHMNPTNNLATKIVSFSLLLSYLFLPMSGYADKPTSNAGTAHSAKVCEKTNQEDWAACHALLAEDGDGNIINGQTPVGLSPAVLTAAYNLPAVTFSSSNRPIIAIVAAYHNPNIYSDLTYYSNYFQLPVLPLCDGHIARSSVACFQQVDQNGTSTFPSVSPSWAMEIALDVEVAHAVCPDCSILLLEAENPLLKNLGQAEYTAAAMGADAISNSWGVREYFNEASNNIYFQHPQVAVVASVGDGGYGVEYPAASRYVASAGGTTLNVDANGNFLSETVWNGTGSGCSAFEPKPVWQTDTGCGNRTVNDVSAVADPDTGAAIYSTLPYLQKTGWFKVGGTSLSSPIIAAVFALANNYSSFSNPTEVLYNNAAGLRDIISGSNGTCAGSYLCTAESGYDGPSGLGVPSGLGGF